MAQTILDQPVADGFQFIAQFRQAEREDRKIGSVLGQGKIPSRSPEKMQRFETGVDQHPGRTIGRSDGRQRRCLQRVPLGGHMGSRQRWTNRPGDRHGQAVETQGALGRTGPPAIDLLAGIQALEEGGIEAGGLGTAEQQEAIRFEGIVKGIDQLGLLGCLEINQQIAAADQVHLDERRMGNDVMQRKDAKFADHLLDPPGPALLGEPALAAFRAEAVQAFA